MYMCMYARMWTCVYMCVYIHTYRFFWSQCDPQGTRLVPPKVWREGMAKVLDLELPWQHLQTQMVVLDESGMVNYMKFLEAYPGPTEVCVCVCVCVCIMCVCVMEVCVVICVCVCVCVCVYVYCVYKWWHLMRLAW